MKQFITDVRWMFSSIWSYCMNHLLTYQLSTAICKSHLSRGHISSSSLLQFIRKLLNYTPAGSINGQPPETASMVTWSRLIGISIN